jgi:3-isopropylmalate dehydrogenase
MRLLDAIKKAIKDDLKSLEAGKMGYGTKEVGDLVADYL